MNGRSKILWGVCGIGNGHTFRQLPLIEYFSIENDIVIFGYGESYNFYKKKFENHPRVSVEKVAVPFLAGNAQGLDFEATAKRVDKDIDYQGINAAAMAAAQARIGKPDLVVSDYEPVSAQYAYAYGAPLVTIDQQSKYLSGDFPAGLNAQCFNDEIMRLHMFFPKAEKRLACSFFKVARNPMAAEDVDIVPPVLGDRITGMVRHPGEDRKSILVYLSAQQGLSQGLEEMRDVFEKFPDIEFHLFSKRPVESSISNLRQYQHGDSRFFSRLQNCSAIITTAGHTLLSEAMHLGIPVYSMPLPIYEQQMNAHVIHENGFGVSHPCLDEKVLRDFIDGIPEFANAIKQDRDVLLRDPGQKPIIAALQRYL